MRAMVLSAGRGQRMRPLTDHVPKPLLEVHGQTLLARHLNALARAGVEEVVINLAWLGEKVRAAVGDGSEFGLHVSYSDESDGVLETGGGICQALPLLGEEPFLVVNGDVWCDVDMRALIDASLGPGDLARLLLVNTPAWRERGDFALEGTRLRNEGEALYTFAGIGVYRPALFDGTEAGRFPLAPLLRQGADEDRIAAVVHNGEWQDVGTPQRLRDLRACWPVGVVPEKK